MKNSDKPIILLDYDGKVKSSSLESYLESEKRDFLYTLFPNPDDNNYFIIENTDFLYIKSGKITYDMCMYSFEEETFDDGNEAYITKKENSIEINDVYSFYCAIYDILKMGYVLQLFYDAFADGDIIEAFIVNKLEITVDLFDGKHYSYSYAMKEKGTIFSRCSKLAKSLTTTFGIPRDFIYSEKVFRVKNNKWSIIDYSKIKSADLIGVVGDQLQTIQFMEYNDFNRTMVNDYIEVEVYGANMEELEEHYPNIYKKIDDSSFSSKIDVGIISWPFEYRSFLLSLSMNQRVEFLYNTRYVCKYVESYGIFNEEIPPEKSICIIILTFESHDLKSKVTNGGSLNRVESTLTKYNPYILR